MFNPHHQQRLRQLQQLLQQQPVPPPPQGAPSHHVPHHHHQGGRTSRPLTAPVPPPPPPPRVVSLGPGSQAAIIAPNPMLRGALLMQQVQGNMRGLAMGGHQFPRFFPAGARPSLLGPVPLAVAIKTPHMGFSPRAFQPQARYFSSDFATRQLERKRESEQPTAGGAGTEGGSRDTAVCREEVGEALGTQTQPSPRQQEDPPMKKRKSERPGELTEQGPETGSALGMEYRSPGETDDPRGCVTMEEGGGTAGPEDVAIVEESSATEILSAVASPDTALQPDNESRTLTAGPGAPPEAVEGTAPLIGSQDETTEAGGEVAGRFFCYICGVTSHNQLHFQSHMNGLAHQQRMMEIQHVSSACLVTLLPHVQESLQGTDREGEENPDLKKWFSTCQIHFSDNLSSRFSCPSCTICRLRFHSPYRFMKHMKSPEHQQRALVLLEKGGANSMENLIANHAEGALEGEEDYEEEVSEEEEEDEDSLYSQEGNFSEKEVTLEDMSDNEVYDQDTQYGSSFMVPVSGFLCRLCHKFYTFDSAAWLSHCKSVTHFKNLQKYRALRKQDTFDGTANNSGGAAIKAKNCMN